MNKTVELVNEWAKFEEKHPDGSIEDFCRYHLISKRVGKVDETQLAGKTLAIEKPILLMRTLGRIVRLFLMYAENAKDKTQLKQFEDFNILNATFHLGEPRKTEVIYESLIELSTGIDILNRLKDLGYIDEKDDPTDKRSKRVSITPLGKDVLFKCYDVFGRVNVMMLKDLAREDIFLCILLLKNVETKFAGLWQQHKGKDFEDIYTEIMGQNA
jgi:DNA-binding MarR family transcriptional regulator